MKTASLSTGLIYKDSKPNIEVLLKTAFTKEIRITFKAGQKMKEHQTPFPIVVECFQGQIDFGVNGEVLKLSSGDLLSLDGGIPHDLMATTDCVVRLTLSTLDQVSRVEKVVD